MEASPQVLEINLISAQGLNRRTKAYAIAWVDPSTKLRTRVDRMGGGNPTWNDKFLFNVSPDFLSRVTSAVSVEIYAVGIFRDKLIGTVRILISSVLPTASSAPAFAAFLIRSPSGEFFGSLNVGAMVVNGFTGFRTFSRVSAVDYHDLGGDNLAGKQLIVRSTNKLKATVRDIPGSIPSDSSVHQSELSESIISPSLKALKLNKRKKLSINLRKATIWKYTMKLLS